MKLLRKFLYKISPTYREVCKLSEKISTLIGGDEKNINTSDNENSFVLIKKNGEKIENPDVKGIRIIFKGKNNNILIHENIEAFQNCLIYCNGDDSKIEIGEFSLDIKKGICINNLIIYTSKGGNVKIGRDFSCGGCEIIADNFGADVEIGDDCMFSKEIIVRSTDGHTITRNGEKINAGKSVKIGNHCWLGTRCAVLKGAVVPDNSIVSFGAVVLSGKGDTSMNLRGGEVLAGVPAKVVNSGINWFRENYDDFR